MSAFRERLVFVSSVSAFQKVPAARHKAEDAQKVLDYLKELSDPRFDEFWRPVGCIATQWSPLIS